VTAAVLVLFSLLSYGGAGGVWRWRAGARPNMSATWGWWV
jgi:hypothetical protein